MRLRNGDHKSNREMEGRIVNKWLRKSKRFWQKHIQMDSVNFGSLRRLTPISREFGYDRGSQSIARYYINRFLIAHAEDVLGRVLEIGDNSYTLRLGGS